MYRLMCAVIACALLIPPSTADGAKALPAQGPTWCANHDFMAESTWVGTFDIVIDGPADIIKWPNAMKTYAKEKQYVDSCANGPSKDLFLAYLSADHAVIRHHDGLDARDDLNLARQLFTKCAARYYAKPQGATCESMAQKMTSLLVKWAT